MEEIAFSAIFEFLYCSFFGFPLISPEYSLRWLTILFSKIKQYMILR
jgi:hypothetical protein